MEMRGSGSESEHGLFREDLFRKWTHGLSPADQRISIFSHIRDIPYAIVPEWSGSDEMIRLMITENRGWCGPKHYLLSWMFEHLGIPVTLISIPFRWQEQPVRYPASLRMQLSTLSDTSHLCCRAYIEGSWVLLDATWDPPLRKAGFPVNDPWDGVSATLPAVIRISNTPDEVMQKPPKIRLSRFEFIETLNKWMEDIRQTSRTDDQTLMPHHPHR